MEVAATSSLPSPSLWSSVNSWFTSTVFFILLNLMIATILFTSNLPNNNQPPQEQDNNDDKDQQKETPKQKQPSILTRLKSFTFEHNSHDDDDVNHHPQPIELAATQYVFNQPMHYQHFDLDQPCENIATQYDFNAIYSGEVVSGADEFSGELQDFETEDTLFDSEPTHEETMFETEDTLLSP